VSSVLRRSGEGGEGVKAFWRCRERVATSFHSLGNRAAILGRMGKLEIRTGLPIPVFGPGRRLQ